MTRFSRILLFALLLVAGAPVHAATVVPLNDTGQDTCYNGSAADSVAASDPASIARDAGTHPRQDCRYGRDAAAAAGQLAKTGGGAKGFDYSKIANNGAVLAAGAALGSNPADWACTKDNITGLTWEVKTTNGGLRDWNNTYTWYSADSNSNGGNVGTANGGACSGGSGCDTEKFVADVNAAALCTYTDWRMPSLRELESLVDFSVLANGATPTIDATYFPNTQISWFWTANNYSSNPVNAWFVNFSNGSSTGGNKPNVYSVRLVRGGQ